ncbi:transcription termination [Musa troglodytarum]|uniref:Transcription termination n=1 Tax=Musa troglodytarum TaxID=320322 RepID=A0A9E7KEJ0_9LILI|nr:transcription termination [Musa troglodytarum]
MGGRGVLLPPPAFTKDIMLRSSSSSSQAPYLQPYPPQSRLRHPHDRFRSSSSSSDDAGLRFREKLLYLEHDLGRLSPLLCPRAPDVARVFTRYPSLLTCDPSAHLLPFFRFLLGPVAIPLPDLRKTVGRFSGLLASSLRPAFHVLRRRTTLLLVSTVEDTLLPKLDYVRGLGFSHEETPSMVLRSAGLLTFSIENNFRPKIEFLNHDMGRDLAELRYFLQ